jgi:hypothetical protein
VGKPDQFVKELCAKNIAAATRAVHAFFVPPETPTTELFADGILQLKDPARLAELPAPWRLAAADETVLEFKMQGDKLGPYEVERALLRRQAWQTQRAKERPQNRTRVPLWIVSAYLPDWAREESLVSVDAPGCYRLEPAVYRVYWIAANELPLREDLIPLLVTRTGRALIELALWLVDTGPGICKELIEVVPMSETQYEELYAELTRADDAEQAQRRQAFAAALAERLGLKDKFTQEGKAEGERLGELRGEAKSVLTILLNRKLAVSEAEKAKILACTDPATLAKWLDLVLTVKTTAELFR